MLYGSMLPSIVADKVKGQSKLSPKFNHLYCLPLHTIQTKLHQFLTRGSLTRVYTKADRSQLNVTHDDKIKKLMNKIIKQNKAPKR